MDRVIGPSGDLADYIPSLSSLPGRCHSQHLAAKCCERARPGLEAAQPVVNFLSSAVEVDAAVFFG